MSTVSVLMTTYAKETAPNLCEALASMYGQTRAPDQVVLVIDGPVGTDQISVIEEFRADPRVPRLDVVQLEEQGGLARALNAGIHLCTGRYIARMDSDDISLPDRLELQLAQFERDPSIDAVATWGEEFFEDGGKVVKVCPVRHETIVNALRWRNVLIHPSITMKAEALCNVGGYSTRFGLMEDYDLFVRLALAGARLQVVPKILLRMRSGLEQRTRRGGFAYFVHELKFRTELLRRGFLNLRQYAITTVLYAAFRLCSGRSRRAAYAMVRR